MLRVIFFLIILPEVLSKLYCEVKYGKDVSNSNSRYGSLIVDSKLFICDIHFEKCCEKGCCSIVPTLPWYIWLIISIAALIFVVFFCLVLQYLRLYLAAVKRRQTRLDVVVTTRFVPERPPSYTLPPSYEEATH